MFPLQARMGAMDAHDLAWALAMGHGPLAALSSRHTGVGPSGV